MRAGNGWVEYGRSDQRSGIRVQARAVERRLTFSAPGPFTADGDVLYVVLVTT